jgi:sulfonate transport system ATP-binding protein
MTAILRSIPSRQYPLLSIAVQGKSFGSKHILGDVSLELFPGEVVTLLGASGCGKSTLLRLIAGLDQGYEGEIFLSGKKLTGISQQIGFIFQEPRLMPWLTVAENVAFQSKSPQSELVTVSALLEEVGLFGTEELLPKQLSGGMAQRVSIARGMFSKPDLLLLDEPFSAVDAFTRMKLQDLLLNMLRLHGNTVLMVTHDIDEAIYVSDRIVVIGGQPGVIRDIIEVHVPGPRDRRDATLTGLRVKVLDALHGINVI